MRGSTFRQENPTPGFACLEVNIPDLADFGTGTYTTVIQVNALEVPFPITCTAVSRSAFQVLLSIFPDTHEVLVLLGRNDSTPPVSQKIFVLPRVVDPSREHAFHVVFRHWTIQTLTLDGYALQEKPHDSGIGLGAQQYVQELYEISKQVRAGFGQGAQEPMLEPVFPTVGSPIPFLQTQKGVLEDLFGEDWFRKPTRRKQTHPAYMRWQFCRNLLSRGGTLRLPEETRLLPELAHMILDNHSIVVCTVGRADRSSMGSLANYGDPEVQKRVRAVIRNPAQFLDVLTELSVAAWHRTQGHEVTAHEKPGFPDFEIRIAGWNLPFAVDCKRLKKGTSEKRIGSVIWKANSQVKALEKPCYGLAMLDISDKVDTPPQLSDEIPKEVVHLKKVVRQATSLHNTSITAVLLLWDDFAIVRAPDSGEDFLTICLRRRSEVIQHSSPKRALEGDIDAISVGTTVMLRLGVTPRALPPDPTVWRPV